MRPCCLHKSEPRAKAGQPAQGTGTCPHSVKAGVTYLEMEMHASSTIRVPIASVGHCGKCSLPDPPVNKGPT